MKPSLAQTCGAYLQAQGLEGAVAKPRRHLPALAIDRDPGTPMAEIESRLLERLRSTDAGWTLFDDNLVSHVLREHHLPEVLARAMPEDRAPPVQEFWRELLAAEPPQWELVQKTNDTLYRLAKRGGCILVGRAAPWVTRGLPHVLRAALTGSPRLRARRIASQEGLEWPRAEEEIRRRDEARHHYITAHFGRGTDTRDGFDLVIDTDHLSPDCIADILARALEDQTA
jgi:cytidylate kinase